MGPGDEREESNHKARVLALFPLLEVRDLRGEKASSPLQLNPEGIHIAEPAAGCVRGSRSEAGESSGSAGSPPTGMQSQHAGRSNSQSLAITPLNRL